MNVGGQHIPVVMFIGHCVHGVNDPCSDVLISRSHLPFIQRIVTVHVGDTLPSR